MNSLKKLILVFLSLVSLRLYADNKLSEAVKKNKPREVARLIFEEKHK